MAFIKTNKAEAVKVTVSPVKVASINELPPMEKDEDKKSG